MMRLGAQDLVWPPRSYASQVSCSTLSVGHRAPGVRNFHTMKSMAQPKTPSQFATEKEMMHVREAMRHRDCRIRPRFHGE